jgi:L-2-hydroxyglutarate oxidase
MGTAYALLKRFPGLSLTVLDKEPEPGRHQSTHNSGVLHAGLYYKPGSNKAQLAVAGIRSMTAFCQQHGITHEICGKLVVAVEEAEITRLRELFNRGTANGLSGLKWLSREEAREIEPHVNCVAAVRVPEEGITDYAGVVRALAGEIQRLGGEVLTSAPAQRIDPADGGWRISTPRKELTADFLVNCAGLYSDRIARLAGERPPARIVPFRGEYKLLKPEARHLVRNLIYPVPDPAFPFLGVHLTRMVSGEIEAGPNAVLAGAREGYRLSKIRPGELLGSLTYPGLWHFLAKYPQMATYELWRSLRMSVFAASLQRLVPELKASDLIPGGAGVRAQAMKPDGSLVDDFLFVDRPNALHVLNAPSPGATASLAIGERLTDRIQSLIGATGSAAVGTA